MICLGCVFANVLPIVLGFPIVLVSLINCIAGPTPVYEIIVLSDPAPTIVAKLGMYNVSVVL